MLMRLVGPCVFLAAFFCLSATLVTRTVRYKASGLHRS